MRCKLVIPVLFSLIVSVFGNCSNNDTTVNTSTIPSAYPNNSSVLRSSANANKVNINSNTNSEPDYINMAMNERLKTPAPVPKRDFSVSTGELWQNFVVKGSKDIEKIAILRRVDNGIVKSATIYLKNGKICELSGEQLPNPEETPPEEILEIVKANDRKCSSAKK